jgi:hypothetical protein
LGVTIEELLKTFTDDVKMLRKILFSRVVAGKVLAADTAALNGMDADLVSGEKVKVVSADGVVSITSFSIQLGPPLMRGTTCSVVARLRPTSMGVRHQMHS